MSTIKNILSIIIFSTVLSGYTIYHHNLQVSGMPSNNIITLNNIYVFKWSLDNSSFVVNDFGISSKTILPTHADTPFIIKFDGVSEAVNDLKMVLQGYKTGQFITITKVPIGERTGQAFYIKADKSNVILNYTCEQSLENAVYTYLSMLGINWYGASDTWLFKPKQLKKVEITGWQEPTFRNRSAFGTGGMDFPSVQSYDPTNQYKKDWTAFMRRNRYNVDFPQVGHAGDVFYLQNKEILDVHPEWFANEAGKKAGRIKIEIPEAVQVYKDWASPKKITTLFTTIGVDPEDGRGGTDDPLPPDGFKGIKKWNHADKWWWLANEVSKNFNENNKNLVVSMYAYGDGATNALAPKFPLRKNVYPVIIPYAFQFAYLPNQMVTEWGKTVKGNMAIYDYWNITQWSLGLPQFSMSSIKPKLTFWKDNKINGINQETTSAAGPMGHIFWLAGQLEWDLNKKPEVLYTQYLNDCFGLAAPELRKMYDRWSNNYQGAADVDFSLINLKSASDLVTVNSPEWKRINELKAYVHFMKLMYAHDESKESMEAIFQWIYGINHLKMVQTAAFLGQNYVAPFNDRPIPKSNIPLTPAEIESQFRKDIDSIKINYSLSDFVFDHDKVIYIKPIDSLAWRFGGFACQSFFKAPFSGEVSIDAGGEEATPIKIFTEYGIIKEEVIDNDNYDYKEVINERIWKLKKFKIKVEKGKIYNIKTRYGFSRVKINTKGIVLFNYQGGEDFDNYAYPNKYFYVPKDATEIVYLDAGQGVNDIRGAGLYNPDGIRVAKQSAGAKDTWKVPVAPTHRGKIWFGSFGYGGWSLKNIPNVVSLQKFGYRE